MQIDYYKDSLKQYDNFRYFSNIIEGVISLNHQYLDLNMIMIFFSKVHIDKILAGESA